MSRIPFSGPKESLEAIVTSVLENLIPQDFEGEDQRHENRKPLFVPISAIVLDKYFRPADEEFTVLTRNLSTQGICLLHTEPIDAKFLALELPERIGNRNLQVVMEIVHTRKVEKVYLIGGKFIMKLT
jgi:hypothetical protein